MKNIYSAILGAALLLVIPACGKNNGTPAKTPSPNRQSGDVEAKPKIEGIDLAQTTLSKDGHWRIATTWSVGSPAFSEDKDIENNMQLLFVTASGAAVDSLSDVAVIPFMTEMGHGNGNRQPRIAIGELGAVAVTDMEFMMAGPWDLIIKGTVDGHADQAVLKIDVKAQ